MGEIGGKSLVVENGRTPNINSNMLIPYFRLGAYDNVAYGSSNIANCGCGICSFAMAASYLTQSAIDPPKLLSDIAEWFGSKNAFYVSGAGTDMGSLLSKVAPNYGLSTSKIEESQVVNKLKAGRPVIFSCRRVDGSTIDERLLWAHQTHIVCLSGVDSEGKIYCNNPSHPEWIGWTYDIEDIHKIVNNGYWEVYSNKYVSLNTLNASAQRNFESYICPGGAYIEGLNANESVVEVPGANGIKQRYIFTTSEADRLDSFMVSNYDYSTEFGIVETQYYADVLKSAKEIEDVLNTGLLTTPTMVEAPFIQVKVGNYTFGTYTGKTFPNHIQSMTVKKVNGVVNEYTIQLKHKIELGADPNFVDKILSSVKNSRVVYISYGDYCASNFAYKNEEALLLKVDSLVDFKGSCIDYTLHCSSNAVKLYATLFSFNKQKAKPSDVIYDMIWGSGMLKYGFKDLFPGMYEAGNFGNRTKFISSDDKEVEIAAKPSMDPLSYLNYLVTCMCAITNTDASLPLKDSTYKLCLFDTNFDESGVANGQYFKVVKVCTSDNAKSTLSNADIYEVDVGYPTDNMVMNFSVNSNDSWAVLYDYAGLSSEISYTVNDNGDLRINEQPSVLLSKINGEMTEVQRTWWTNMTRFPVSAQLTLKGLARSAMLMSYVRINAMFYGQKHVSSGLYIITAEEDSISGAGCRTTLSLLRISGTDDYVERELKTKQTKLILNWESTTSYVKNELLEDTIYTAASTYSISDGTQQLPLLNQGWSTYTMNVSTQGLTEFGDVKNAGQFESVYPIYAAAYVAMDGLTELIELAVSAAMQRKADYIAAGVPNMTLAEFIHCNRSAVMSYNKYGNSHFDFNLYAKYSKFANEGLFANNLLFSADAIYAYDAVVKAVLADDYSGNINMQTIKYSNHLGLIKTIPALPDTTLLLKLSNIVISGACSTTANYFSNTYDKFLYADSYGSTLEVKAATINQVKQLSQDLWDPNANIRLYDSTTGAADCKYVGEGGVKNPKFRFSVLTALRRSVTEEYTGDWRVDLAIKLWQDGYTQLGACAIVGNIQHESASGGPTCVEYTFADDLMKYYDNVNWKSYADVNAGITAMLNDPNSDIWRLYDESGDFENDPKYKFYRRKAWDERCSHTYWGYGLAQWTSPAQRKLNFANYMRELKQGFGDFDAQVRFILLELSTLSEYASAYEYLREDGHTIDEYTRKFMKVYEGVDSGFKSRLKYAKEVKVLWLGS